MRRVPRVSRIEYIFTFLKGVNKKLTTQKLAQKLGECKLHFEERKYKALGRRRPKITVASSLVQECIALANKLGLAEVDKGFLSLTSTGLQLLRLPLEEGKDTIASLYVNSIDIVKEIMIKMNMQKGKEFLFPDYRHGKFKKFSQYVSRYNIDIDVLSFVALRDILWQLGYVNWYQFRKDKDYWFKVYLTARITKNRLHSYTLTFVYNTTTFYVRRNKTTMEDFTKTLWVEYMRYSNDVHFIPIFYSDIRNAVCYKLKISDATFDNLLKELLTQKEPTFRVMWSSAAVPHERDTLSLLKNLPPLSPEGQYMTYLLIGKE
jgi:hypothetical protein